MEKTLCALRKSIYLSEVTLKKKMVFLPYAVLHLVTGITEMSVK